MAAKRSGAKRKAPAKRSGKAAAGTRKRTRRAADPRPAPGTDWVAPAAVLEPPAPEPTPGADPLPEWRRERFCWEYLADGIGTQAAIRAGYSPNGANVAGVRLLSDATVRARVDYLKAERTQRLRITADRVLEELAAIAFSDMGDVLEPEHPGPGDDRTLASQADGTEARLLRGLWRFRNLEDIHPVARRAIQEVSDTMSTDGKRRRALKLHPKLPALQILAEHTRVLVKRLEHSGPGGGPIPVESLPETEEQAAKRLDAIIAQGRARRALAEGHPNA